MLRVFSLLRLGAERLQHPRHLRAPSTAALQKGFQEGSNGLLKIQQGTTSGCGNSQLGAASGPNRAEKSKYRIDWMTVCETVSFLVLRTVARALEKLQTVLPLTAGNRDSWC